jgi:hypothetical protein
MEGGLMPHYEIVAHVIRELDCETAEDAAAIVRRQLLADARRSDKLVHLAVWREEPESSGSPVSAPVRQKLVDFFSSLERSAGEAEAVFRGRVAAILGSSTIDVTDVADSSSPVAPRSISSVVTQENLS